MAHLYFDETLSGAQPGDDITVDGDEARHAVKVSRLRAGEDILVGNGAGLICEGTVTDTTPTSFGVRVHETRVVDAPEPRVWIVQALAKGDRAERAVELSTEFGASGFLAWQASRSIVRWDTAKAEKGLTKWRRIAREASKQSLRAHIPRVGGLVATADLCEIASNEEAHVIVLHPRNATRLSDIDVSKLERDVYVCVGPEGGVSDAEVDDLLLAGATIAVVGSQVLRTSSAGAAGLATLNLALGRW